LLGPDSVRIPREGSKSFRRPRFLMGSRARQVGFMSTQKRENRASPATKIRRRAVRCRWQRIKCTERARGKALPSPAHFARYVRAVAGGRTAPLLSILWSTWAWLATQFLQPDHHFGQLVRPVLKADHRGSQPPGVSNRAALGTQASPRSSLPHIPDPSGLARLHLPLPQVPAGYHRRAERYDGKRDMYFQHAA
jgi:hypothetical protein